jgi:hypothetical protein
MGVPGGLAATIGGACATTAGVGTGVAGLGRVMVLGGRASDEVETVRGGVLSEVRGAASVACLVGTDFVDGAALGVFLVPARGLTYGFGTIFEVVRALVARLKLLTKLPVPEFAGRGWGNAFASGAGTSVIRHAASLVTSSRICTASSTTGAS